jgi:hypothetical protein
VAGLDKVQAVIVVGANNLYTMDHFRLTGKKLEVVHVKTGFEYNLVPVTRSKRGNPRKFAELERKRNQDAAKLQLPQKVDNICVAPVINDPEDMQVVLSVKRVEKADEKTRAWGTYVLCACHRFISSYS